MSTFEFANKMKAIISSLTVKQINEIWKLHKEELKMLGYTKVDLDCCEPVVDKPCPAIPVEVTPTDFGCSLFAHRKSKKKEQDMYTNINATLNVPNTNPDEGKTQYLLGRLYNIKDDKTDEAETKFNIRWNDLPKTPAELIARLTTGKFTYKLGVNADGTWKEEAAWHNSPITYIDWRTVPADNKGYDAFRAAMNDEATKVEDAIRILPAADGLAALQKFEELPIQ